MLDAAEDEHPNLRFLLADRLSVKPRRALDLAITASEFWAARGFSVEGRRWIQDAIAAAQPEGPQSWDATLALAHHPYVRGDLGCCARHSRSSSARYAVWIPMKSGLRVASCTSRFLEGGQAILRAPSRRSTKPSPCWSARVRNGTRVLFDRLRGLQLAANGDLLGARVAQRAAVPQSDRARRPDTAAQAVYLSAVLGDMAGCDDVTDDIQVARELATAVRDVSLLGQMLLLEARALKRAGDSRSRELFAEAAERLMGFGGIRAASLAYRDLGLLELAGGEETIAHRPSPPLAPSPSPT